MNIASNLSGISTGGCTPCECGIPGACLQESLPSFLQFIPYPLIHIFTSFALPLAAVLIPALIVRLAIKHIFKTANASLIRSVSVMVGSLFVLPSIFSYFQPNTIPESLSLIAPITAITITYLGLTIFDLKNKKASIVGTLLGAIALSVVISLVVFSYKTSTQAQYNQIIETRKTGVSEILQILGLMQRSDEVVRLLKSKDYISLETYLNPSKKLIIYFRDYDGANFSKQEFHNIQSSNKLSEVNVYKRVDDFTITAQELLNVVSQALNSDYDVDYYIDNHNYADNAKQAEDYTEANFLYKQGGKTTTLTFAKDSTDSVWYLSKIGYFDMDYPGY